MMIHARFDGDPAKIQRQGLGGTSLFGWFLRTNAAAHDAFLVSNLNKSAF
ncbi:hypothetical protein [Brevundimonas sp.]|nr:hypothetical protein [Brevundimonas sp.]